MSFFSYWEEVAGEFCIFAETGRLRVLLSKQPVAQFQIYQFHPAFFFPSNVTWFLRSALDRRKNTVKKRKLDVLFHLRNRPLSIKLIVQVYPFTAKEPAITIKGVNAVFESNARPVCQLNGDLD